jgi:DNA polymerase-3 subunit alpha
MDFMERLDHHRVNKKALESLVKCGAFDWTGQPRRRLFEGLDALIGVATSTQLDRAAGQGSLFGATKPRVNLPDVGEWPTALRLSGEREALGFFISGHPVAAYADILSKVATCTIRELEQVEPESEGHGRRHALGAPRREDEARIEDGVLHARGHRRERRVRLLQRALAPLAEGARSGPADPRARQGRARGRTAAAKERRRTSAAPRARRSSPRAPSSSATSRERRTSRVRIVVDAHEIENGRIEGLREVLGRSRGSCPVTLSVRFENQARGDFALPDDLRVIADDTLLQGSRRSSGGPGVAELA